MSFSYNPAVPSDLDFVRLKCGDTDPTSPQLQDEEIAALLADEANFFPGSTLAVRYSAAATALSMLLARWAGAGRGVVSIQVSRLSIHQGVDQSAVDAVRAEISSLKAQALAAAMGSGGSALLNVL